MATVVYPTSLPQPSRWEVKSPERAGPSTLPGNTQLRNRWRDAVDNVMAEWMYDSAQMTAWDEWYREILLNGQLWTGMIAPGRGGWINRVVRYRTKTLKKQYLGNGVFIVSAEMLQRGVSAAPQSYTSVPLTVNLDGITNAGATSAVGVTVSGLNPATTYTLTMPAGLTYTAWRSDAIDFPNNHHNRFSVSTTGGTTVYGSVGHATAEAARLAFPGATISGYASYTFWINDDPSADNDGGLSIRVASS